MNEHKRQTAVARFFEKGVVKSFPKKMKNSLERRSVKVAALTLAFSGMFAGANAQKTARSSTPEVVKSYVVTEQGDTLCSYNMVKSDSVTSARLRNLVNTVAKTETGLSVLKKASKLGTTISMDCTCEGTVGFYSEQNNAVCLNAAFSDARLQSNIVHECEHARQCAEFGRRFTVRRDLYSNIKVARAMEAGAVAKQICFAYELAQRGDSLAFKELRNSSDHKIVANVYASYAELFGEKDPTTMEMAARAWYADAAYVAGYDASVINGHEKGIKDNSVVVLQKLAFKNNVSNVDIAQKILTMNGKSYVVPQMLDEVSTTTVTESVAKEIKSMNNSLKLKANVSDKSVVFLYDAQGKSLGVTKDKGLMVQLTSASKKQRSTTNAAVVQTRLNRQTR